MAVRFKNGRQGMRSLVLASALVSALVSVLVSGEAAALAPEHETRRLMLATEEAVADKNWSEAGEYLNRLQQLEGEKPAPYFFYRGRVMFQSSLFNEAQSALEAYIAEAGAEGKHYQESLKLITEVEKSRKARALAPPTGEREASKIAVIEPAGDQKIAALRKLYLASSNRQALTLHLNSLLEVSGWRQDKTIVRMDKPADVEYRISTGDSTITIQEMRRDESGRVMRRTEPLSVYGVNPQVEWGCEAAAGACWIYDPRDGSRLLQLAVDREPTQEIARTLGQLIRDLQGPTGS